MAEQTRTWLEWKQYFEARTQRALPDLESDHDYSTVPKSVARSLAIFQLGESGGGTVIAQAGASRLRGVNSHYGRAVDLFVAEEHRHANILALCVRLLGGELIRDNWTAKLFVFARRLIGLRLKVVVLLAAEVVGLCYYHLLAAHLPESKLRKQLLEIVEDERDHLAFHCDFLRSQIDNRFKRILFIVTWRCVMSAAMIAVAIDHRQALSDMKIGFWAVSRRWNAYSRLAQCSIVQGAPELARTSRLARTEFL